MARVAALVAGALLAACAAASAAPPTVLLRAHAHNDYEHAKPLFDALDHGFCSVEADIWLVDGQLLVAHELEKVRADRTLQALYLDPLRERVKRNGGRLFAHGPECTLLIDVKSNGTETYPVLRSVLESYADILTVFRGDKVERKAIEAILTGNRAPSTIALEPIRYAALDGALADLSSGAPPDLVPWISSDWRRTFTWNGSGTMPAAEERLLRQIVADAHRQGRKVRFWSAPDMPDGWAQLWSAGVDLINTDDLAGLEGFLRSRVASR